MIKELQSNKFSLVLSGGGALGIAHLGVIEDLQKKSLNPSEIVGTSMGGIVGACVALGLSTEQILNILDELSSVYKWIKFSFSGNAIVDSSKIEKILIKIFGDKSFEDVQIPLKIIATNIANGQKRVFSKEDNLLIKDALLATMAIPGIFSEKEIDGIIYADGFLCENLGLNEASFDTILAVDVLGFNSFEKELPDNFFKTSNVLEMFEKSMRLLIYNQTNLIKKSIDKKLFLLEPETKDYKTYHFNKVKEIKNLGLNLLLDMP